MKKFITPVLGIILVVLVVAGCETLKNLPTNTTGGLFSLNGTWKLNATTDDKALVGSIVTVYPVVGNASVKSVLNNNYCIKEGDLLWTKVKSNSAGGFTLESLVSACDGKTVKRDAILTVIKNDEVTITTRTASGTELIQQWQRINN